MRGVETRRAQYILDTEGLTEVERLATCRTALNVIAVDAVTFETDIPWTMAADWPLDVAQAAQHLQSASRKPREDPNYGQTGVLRLDDETTWRAFVTFAPWAFDATVWSASHGDVASLSDSSDSIVLRLTDAQRRALEAEVGDDRLVTVTGSMVTLRNLGIALLVLLADVGTLVIYAISDSAWVLIFAVALTAAAALLIPSKDGPPPRRKTHRHRA